jgi:coenzyme F420 biosynthesis associated uncharacterized protein
MTEPAAVVNWGVAERVAHALIGGLPSIPGREATAVAQPYTAAEVERACVDALDTVAAYAGLGAVERPPAAELIDRREWSGVALSTLAEAAKPIEARIAAEVDLPGPLGGVARRGIGAAVGTEAGLAAGYSAKRVLGQYDLALFGPARPARLLFVAENMDAARSHLDAERQVFLRWVALHECTHVLQFERVPWLAGHLRSLVATLLDGAAEGLDSAAIAAIVRRLLRDPREIVRALLRGELSRLLSDPRRRLVLDRLQATMSVVEGHAEHVMDASAAELGPQLAELRERLDARRARRGGLGDLIARLLGMDLKLRQYELGKRFCDAVVGAAGPEGLLAVWRSAEDLPDLDELEQPGRWLARVGLEPIAAAAR